MKNASVNKKTIIIVAIVVAVVVAAAATVTAVLLTKGANGGGTGEVMAAMDIGIDGNVLSWDEVPDAAGYVVEINGTLYDVAGTSLDLDTLSLAGGSLAIRVRAKRKNGEETEFSDWTHYTYEPIKTHYEVQVLSAEGGSVEGNEKIYSAGSVVSLVATPNDGYHFDGWYSDKYYKIYSDNEFTFAVNADTVLVPRFSLNAAPAEVSQQEDTAIMDCPTDFVVMVSCKEANAAEYVRKHVTIYDDYFLDSEGNVVGGYEEYAVCPIGEVQSRGDNVYAVIAQRAYDVSGTFVVKSTGNVSLLKEYSRLVNATKGTAAAGENVGAPNEEGSADFTFSIDNTPHADMQLRDDVYIYSYKDNTDATYDNVDGWINECIGVGVSDEENGTIGGFITTSIQVRGDHTLQVGDVVGFGGRITRDIQLDQITDKTVFGRVKSITYCGDEIDYRPIIFVELEHVDDEDEVFSKLDVYQEDEVDLDQFVEENRDALEAQLMAEFNASEDAQNFYATVACAAEAFAMEREYTLLDKKLWDVLDIKAKVTCDSNKFLFTLNGSVDYSFLNKKGRFGETSGKLTVKFEFKESLKLDYSFAWVRTSIFKIKKGIDFKLKVSNDASFTFDAAVKFTAGTHTVPDTGFLLNENTKWIHVPSCPHVKKIKDSNKKNTTETLEELELKGYTPCRDCIASPYLVNTSTKCIHKSDCWHIDQMLPENKKSTNLSLETLEYQGYWPCGTCLAAEKEEWKNRDSEEFRKKMEEIESKRKKAEANKTKAEQLEKEAEELRKELSESLIYTKWENKLNEIKTKYAATGLADSSKDFKFLDIPISCFVIINIRAYLTLSFSLEASLHYEQSSSASVTWGLHAAIGDGFHTSYDKAENAKSNELTIVGKIGIKAGIKLEVTVADPIGLVKLGVYASVGAYAELTGVAHVSSKGENYAAAYLEVGIYYDFGVTYRIFYIFKGELSLAKMLGLDGKYVLLRMGYDSAVYAYQDDVSEVLLLASEDKKEFTLKELGLTNVKTIGLPSLKADTTTLDVSTDEYEVSLVFEKAKYFAAKGNNIVVKDNAPLGSEFEDTVTIAVRKKDAAWKAFSEHNSVLYLPTIEVKLVCALQCLNHNLILLPAEDATCDEDGWEDCLRCTKCNKLFDVDGTTQLDERPVVASLGHDYLHYDAVQPDCYSVGYTEYTICTRCGQYGVAPETLEALGHSVSDKWETVVAPTCESQGSEGQKCERCNTFVAYRAMLPLGHSPSTRSPSCGESVICTVCNKMLAKPRAHDDELVSAASATCLEDGVENYVCATCGRERSVVLPKLGHTTRAEAPKEDVKMSKQPTCTETGTYTYHCLRCAQEVNDSIATLRHKMATEYSVDVPRGCLTPGECSLHCLNAGCTYRENVQALPAIGHHEWGDWACTVEPTCVVAGSETSECKRCHQLRTQPIQPLDHDWGEWQEYQAVTCTAAGAQVCECNRCHELSYQDINGEGMAPEIIHSLIYMDAKVPANCQETGWAAYAYCDREGCDYTTYRPYFGSHIMEEDAAVAATCVTTGLTQGSHCAYCEYAQKQQETPIDPTNHTLAGENHLQVYLAETGTCSAMGKTEGCYCDLCGYTIEQHNTPMVPNNHAKNDQSALAHRSFVSETCTQDGYNEHWYCSACECYFGDAACTIDLDYETEVRLKAHNDLAEVKLTHVPERLFCTKEGNIEHYKCETCGKTYEDANAATRAYTVVVGAQGHIWGAPIEHVEKTCVQYEHDIYHCRRGDECNYYSQDKHYEYYPEKGYGDHVYDENSCTCSTQGCGIELHKPNASCICIGKNCGLRTHVYGDDHLCTQCRFHEPTAGVVYTKNGKEYTVTSYSGTDSIVYLSDNTVAIAAGAFRGSAIIEIHIPFGVKSIGSYAFAECANLAEFVVDENNAKYYCEGQCLIQAQGKKVVAGCQNSVLPANVTCIGEGAFFGCTKLTSLTLPDIVTAIEKEAFYGCSGLTEIVVPNNVGSIGLGAFGGCTSLRTLTIPFVGATSTQRAEEPYQYPFGYIFGTNSSSGVSTQQQFFGKTTDSLTTATYYIPSSLSTVTVTGGTILYGAFYNCTTLTSITIPANITAIPSYAFYNCSKLSSMSLPTGVTDIGVYAFAKCRALSAISLPAGVKTIAGHVFYGCSSLYSVTFGGPVTDIGESAFESCTYLAQITIPNGVTSIGAKAFYACRLTAITLPTSVTVIGKNAFNSSSIATVTYLGNMQQWFQIDGLSGLTQCSEKALYIGGKLMDTVTIDSTTSIPEYAFYKCSSLTSVTISGKNTQIDIGDTAFGECNNLQTVKLNRNVRAIGPWAFADCASLKTVTFGVNVTTIGRQAFKGCSSIESVSFDKNVTKIEEHAFDKCSGLKTVSLGNGVTTIGGYAFTDCSSLTTVNFGSKVTTIGPHAFAKCTALQSISIGANVTTIELGAFANCTALKTVSMGNNVKTIGEEAFRGCSKLETINLSSKLTTIGSKTFVGTSSLTQIIIPSSVTTIGSKVFADGTSSWNSALTIYCEATAAGQNWDSSWNKDTKIITTPTIDTYYFRSTQPSESGKFWHYVSGKPQKWS